MIKKNIAVLLTVHNRKATTMCCLEHLYGCNLKGIGLGIIVYLVDDGSIDGTADSVKLHFPQVNILKGDGSLYWNGGMLKAWEEALKHNYDYYLWLNDDTILYEDAILTIMSDYEKSENLSILTGATCSTYKHNITTYGGFKNGLVSPNGDIQEVDVINGNFVLVPSCVCEKIGILDKKFTHSYGDREYSTRCRKNGIKVYLTSKYIGECERHQSVKKCYNAQYGMKQRIKHFFSPTGNPPSELFYLYRNEKGAFFALKIVMANLFACLCPIMARKFIKIPI